MPDRRFFISGLLAAGLTPRTTWADVGAPAYLSAGKRPDGAYVLCGLTAAGDITFQLPLPARGHAAAAHPTLAQAVAFARRPGTFAIVLDCLTGAENARLTPPKGRHFYGHGTFSEDGDLLFTTENDIDTARGMIGAWDVRRAYTRIGDFPSGGIGPHDIKLMPDGETLVVANGGIETHPETGRTKLNIPTMRPNLSYLRLDGALIDQLEMPSAHRKNSIRHLAVARTGAVAFAMQWQGDLHEDLPLLGMHDPKKDELQMMDAASVRHMNGYLGSVAITSDGGRVATTSPRSGRLQVFQHCQLQDEIVKSDVCGVAPLEDGFMSTTGTGHVTSTSGLNKEHNIAWDNHLVGLHGSNRHRFS
ncbi:MAG: DUF1513 domain-containing protein [Pseudomonadota bacterium]